MRQKLPSAEYLRGDGKHIYDFIVEFTTNFGDVPTKKLVQEHTGVDLDPDPLSSDEELAAPSLWWADQLMDRHLQEALQETLRINLKHLEAGRPQQALDLMEKAIKGIRRDRMSVESGVEGIGTLSREVFDYYKELKAGKRGILTPWDGINQASLGLWPQDLALFVARAGVGKTWTATLIALHAWANGKKVLFATTEISRMRIAMRMLAVKFKFNYNDFRSGKLSYMQEEYFEQQCAELMKDNKFHVAGGNFDFRIESFTALVEEYAPDLCILDGAYLLRVEGKTRTEKAANAFDEVKRIANSSGVPMLCTMQFNRQAKANMASTADLSNIGLTDVAGWNADLAYALVQSDDQKLDGIMEFHPMKVREGVGEVVTSKWDLDNMVFDQIAVGEANKTNGGGDASEDGDSKPFDPINFDSKVEEKDDTPF
jgi:replicative DNA helicase